MGELMFKLGELIYNEGKFSQSRQIFIKILEKDPVYLERMLQYFPSVDLRNYTKETYLVHEAVSQGTLSAKILITKYDKMDAENCTILLTQRIPYDTQGYSNRETYFSPEEIRTFLDDLVKVVQNTPRMMPNSANIFERNISSDSGFEFNWIGKKNKKGKLSIEIKYGYLIPDISMSNIGELQLVIKKTHEKLMELGYLK